MNEKIRTAMCWLRRTHAVVVRKARVGRVKDVRDEKWRSGRSDKSRAVLKCSEFQNHYRYSAMHFMTVQSHVEIGAHCAVPLLKVCA